MMRIGVNVDNLPGIGVPEPSEIPAQVARFQAIDGPPFTWTASYAKQLKAAGKSGLARSPWYRLSGWTGRDLWIERWATNINIELHEFGNEPHPEDWITYRHAIRRASPILRASGRKVILAAARTNRTTEWLSTTPDSVWEAVDGVALHPYAETPREVLEITEEARLIVPEHLSLYGTEFGWAVGSTDYPDHALVVETEEEQADKIEHTLRLLQKHAERLKLKLASVFMHRDCPPNGRWWQHAGTRDENDKPRLSYKVVLRASNA